MFQSVSAGLDDQFAVGGRDDEDGVFDNASERAQISVPSASSKGRFTLTFPAILTGSVGITYVRFRLSTDTAAANATGAATDGEVEDWKFVILNPSKFPAEFVRPVIIAKGLNGGPGVKPTD